MKAATSGSKWRAAGSNNWRKYQKQHHGKAAYQSNQRSESGEKAMAKMKMAWRRRSGGISKKQQYGDIKWR